MDWLTDLLKERREESWDVIASAIREEAEKRFPGKSHYDDINCRESFDEGVDACKKALGIEEVK